MIGLLFVVVTCWIGIVAAGVDDDTDDIEVSEGENLTISIHIKKSDEDPQVLVTRLNGSSQEPIAQLFCYNGNCSLKYWESGVSLIYDGGNVTLILMDVSHNQTGLYTVLKLSVTPLENKIYNLTVDRIPAPLSIISPSVMYSKSFIAGITSAVLVLIILVLIITGAIGVVYWKRSKETSYKVSQNDDTAASSVCGSLTVIDI
ncbi:hypothetical protein R3I94_017558 [Phoxinus phoxinus]